MFNLRRNPQDPLCFFYALIGTHKHQHQLDTGIQRSVTTAAVGSVSLPELSPASLPISSLFLISLYLWYEIVNIAEKGRTLLYAGLLAYACELFREEHQALGLSAISTSWGIGLIIGPALGGYLAQETLHFHKKDELESASNVPDVEEKASEGKDSNLISLLKNWPLMSSIIVYCIFSLHDMAYTEIFSLWAVSPTSLGGLNYSTENVGTILSITGENVSIITSTFMLQNKAVDQRQRGAANGIAMTLQSICKAIGPACGGALLSWCQRRRRGLMPANYSRRAYDIFHIERNRGNWSSADVQAVFDHKPLLVCST
ncbi:major facilitator superfamily domain protein [Tanacetum coccineum]